MVSWLPTSPILSPSVSSSSDGAPSISLFEPPVECSTSELLYGLGGTDAGITVSAVRHSLSAAGFLPGDPRLATVLAALATAEEAVGGGLLSPREFLAAAKDSLTLLHRVATQELALADFQAFTEHIGIIYEKTESNMSGKTADYIPALRDADPDMFGVSFCSVDGQFLEMGDSRDIFSVQSTSKAITYACALQNESAAGATKVSEWCGVEPSGRAFDDPSLLPDKRPYNPMVNSGAMMTAGVLASQHPSLAARDGPTGPSGAYGSELCTSTLMPVWRRLTADGIVGDVGFDTETFLSEHATADNNRALAYMLKAQKGLPSAISVDTMLDLYLRSCSISSNCASMSILAATLANGGRNPITNEVVIDVEVVKRVLSVMTFCGQYDAAGEFFLHAGMPSKTGVSGVLICVLPNVGGFAVFSPRLDQYGNSVRGASFAKELVERFSLHMFDSFSAPGSCRLDPRFSCDFTAQRATQRIRWAISVGDSGAVAFSDFLTEICLRVAMVDGPLDTAELRMLDDVFARVMGVELDTGRREAVCRRVEEDGLGNGENALTALIDRAKRARKGLTDGQKDLTVESAFAVACADGHIGSAEHQLLRSLTAALGVSAEILELRVRVWKKNRSPRVAL